MRTGALHAGTSQRRSTLVEVATEYSQSSLLELRAASL